MHMNASEDEKFKKEKIPNYMSKVICARAFFHRCFVSERFARAPSHARSRRQVEILCSYYYYLLWYSSQAILVDELLFASVLYIYVFVYFVLAVCVEGELYFVLVVIKMFVMMKFL